MSTSNDILLIADTWSADVALGAAELIIQPDSGFTMLAYIGAAAPGAGIVTGTIEVPKEGLRLEAPLFSAGDKCFLLSVVGPGAATVVRGAGYTALSLLSPLVGAFTITPDDGSDLPRITRQIRVTGNGGNLAVVWADGATTVEPVSAGDVWDWRIVRVLATGTTATGLRGYY